MKSFLLAVACLFPAFAFGGVSTTSVDIGQVGAAGSTSTANDVYTVRASGADIWGTQDEFRFVYAQLSGDGEVTARVDSVTPTDPWTKAGVMIRETLSANSRFAYTLVSASEGSYFEHRLSPGALAGPWDMADPTPRAPYWVRVRRVGSVFTGYVSADGQNWKQQGASVTIAMGANVYAGLALTSGVDGWLATAAFSTRGSVRLVRQRTRRRRSAARRRRRPLSGRNMRSRQRRRMRTATHSPTVSRTGRAGRRSTRRRVVCRERRRART